jgi:hypothetical protein
MSWKKRVIRGMNIYVLNPFQHKDLKCKDVEVDALLRAVARQGHRDSHSGLISLKAGMGRS